MNQSGQHLRPVEERILAVVHQAQGPCPSGEVVRQLSDLGFANAEVKIALWNLVDRKQLRFDMDWRLIAHDVARVPAPTLG